jgi:hypothetical protein
LTLNSPHLSDVNTRLILGHPNGHKTATYLWHERNSKKWNVIYLKSGLAASDDNVPRPMVIPEHRFLFIIIEKEGHGKS